MIRNHIRTAFANFRRQPGYVLLNVLGLTLGVAAALFILLYVSTELRFDRFNSKGDRIYRISADITEPDDAFKWAVTQTPLGLQVKADFAEVEEFVRYIPNGRTRIRYEDETFFSENFFLTDSTLLDVFDYDIVAGNAVDPLHNPNTVMLSRSMADRIFGNQDPIGKLIKTDSDTDREVTAVYEDVPPHSHIQPEVLMSTTGNDRLMNPTAGMWGGFGVYTYVLLKENADPRTFANNLPEIIKTHVAVIFDQFDIKINYELIPLFDIHLKSDFENEAEPTGQMSFIYIFSAVALFLLLIACINYMNLATARGTKRALEVGVRKVLGSNKNQLVWQFLSESILLAAISILISCLLVLVLVPLFNSTFNLELERAMLFSKPVLLGILVILLLTGILSGSYPAFYLSRFKPIDVLKSTRSTGAGNPNLRRALVMVQFAITLFMIIGTGIIYSQMNFLRNKDLGFDKDHLLTLSLTRSAASERYNVFRDQLLQHPKISNVSSSTSSPGAGFGKQVMLVENSEGVMDDYGVDFYGVDFDFFPCLGIDLAEGRNFDRQYASDSSLAVVVNESMVERMGWDNPIGKRMQINGVDTLPMSTVVGVVNDFHQQSLYENISALVFLPRFNNGSVQVRTKPSSPEDLSSIVSSIESTWTQIFPETPFSYDFIDDTFMELYQADQVRTKIFTLFSFLMIVIACLGLLGLASFIAEQRTKEIGVRKVLGANTSNIVYLLTRNFAVLVVIASIPASLAAWYFMTKWLETFSYHTDMNPGLFLLAFALVLVITIVTTSYHAFSAAVRNPVEALRQN